MSYFFGNEGLGDHTGIGRVALGVLIIHGKVFAFDKALFSKAFKETFTAVIQGTVFRNLGNTDRIGRLIGSGRFLCGFFGSFRSCSGCFSF